MMMMHGRVVDCRFSLCKILAWVPLAFFPCFSPCSVPPKLVAAAAGFRKVPRFPEALQQLSRARGLSGAFFVFAHRAI